MSLVVLVWKLVPCGSERVYMGLLSGETGLWRQSAAVGEYEWEGAGVCTHVVDAMPL